VSSLEEEFLLEKSEKLDSIEEETGGLEEVTKVSIMENESSSENEAPMPDEVDNEVTILTSPFPSPPFVPLSEEMPEEHEHSSSQAETTLDPDECEEEVVIIQTKGETTENMVTEEVPANTKAYEEVVRDPVVEQISEEVEILEIVHQDEEGVNIDESTAISRTETPPSQEPTPAEGHPDPPPQIQNAELEVESLALEMEPKTTEVMSEPVMNEVEEIQLTTEPTINPIVLTQPLNNVIISSPSSSPIPLSPITTTSIRFPMPHPSGVSTTPQPLVLRMVSLTPPNGPIQQSPSVRLAPPQQPNALQPILLKTSMGTGGVKSEPVRNLIPKVLSEFIPVQPRTFLALADAGKPAHGQSVSPLTWMNGPGTNVGGVQSPGSPGNVSSLLSSKKIIRQKPRQVRRVTSFHLLSSFSFIFSLSTEPLRHLLLSCISAIRIHSFSNYLIT